MPPDLYGPIVGAGALRRAALDTLRVWLPAYLAEVERQTPGRTPGEIPQPKSWQTLTEFDRFPEQQLPAMVIVSPGTAEEPERDGDGFFSVVRELQAAIVVGANTEENSLALAECYVDAAFAALTHHPSLGGFAQTTVPIGDRFDEVEIEQRRSLMVGTAAWRVRIRNVLSAHAGPVEPPEDPLADPGDWPEALTADTDVQQREE